MAFTKIYIPSKGEQHAPGTYHMKSFLLKGSDADSTAAAGVSAVVGVQASSDDPVFIKEVRCASLVAHDAAGTIEIGDSGLSDGFLTAVLTACTTAVTSGLYKSSMTADSHNTYGIGRGKLYSADQNLEVTYNGITSGTLEVIVEYVVL